MQLASGRSASARVPLLGSRLGWAASMGQKRDRRLLQQHEDGYQSRERRGRAVAAGAGGAAAASGGKGDGKGRRSYAAAAAAAGGSGKGGGKGDKRPISWLCYDCRINVDSHGLGACPECLRPCPGHIRNWGKARPAGGVGGPTGAGGNGASKFEAENKKLLARIKELEKAAKSGEEAPAGDEEEADGDAAMPEEDMSTKTALAEAETTFQQHCQAIRVLKETYKCTKRSEDDLEMDAVLSVVFGPHFALKRAAKLVVDDLRKTAFNEKPLVHRLRKKEREVNRAKDKWNACSHEIIEAKEKRENLVKQLAECDAGLAKSAVLVKELREAADALQLEFEALEAGRGRAEADEDDEGLGRRAAGVVPKAAGAPPAPRRGSATERAEWEAAIQGSGYENMDVFLEAMGYSKPAPPPPAEPLANGQKSTKRTKPETAAGDEDVDVA